MSRAKTGCLLDTGSVISQVWEVRLVRIPNMALVVFMSISNVPGDNMSISTPASLKPRQGWTAVPGSKRWTFNDRYGLHLFSGECKPNLALLFWPPPLTHDR
jgi:hypothetical protein